MLPVMNDLVIFNALAYGAGYVSPERENCRSVGVRFERSPRVGSQRLAWV
jgi:hypothetical protein